MQRKWSGRGGGVQAKFAAARGAAGQFSAECQLALGRCAEEWRSAASLSGREGRAIRRE